MTAPTAAKKSTSPVTKPASDKIEENKAEETVKVESRIPEVLSGNSILKEFCLRYLDTYTEISEYNKAVLAEKDSEWNAGKVLEKAREWARPTDKNVEPKKEIKVALEAYENLISETAKARKAILDLTSGELGITLSATADRNPEIEAPLKEKRKVAIEIGSQLSMIAKMTSDEKASDAVVTFLAENPLPAIGRDQTRTFGTDGKSTPKYRVTIEISKDGSTLLSEDGFTKTALALTKPAFGYERGKAPKSDALREAWEKAGNTPEKTNVNPVEFEDNGLHYKISKK